MGIGAQINVIRDNSRQRAIRNYHMPKKAIQLVDKTQMHNILPHNGEIYFIPDFLNKKEADHYLKILLHAIKWEQQSIKIFGRQVPQPRLTAAFADEGVVYGYSGLQLDASAWTPELLEIKSKIQSFSNETFNTALLNLYRNGRDSMGWHRDNEKELGKEPVIASLSLGATRKFLLREKATKSGLISLSLTHGSLILMRGKSQQYWEHSVPKTVGEAGERVNVTFRRVH